MPEKRIKIAVAIVQNSKGKVLIQERLGTEVTPRSGKTIWLFPGINIEESETPEEDLEYAIKHKTGFSIKVEKLIGERDHSEIFGHHLYYACSLKKPSVAPFDYTHETQKVRWVDPKDLKDYFTTSLFPPVAEYLGIEAFDAKE